MTVVRIIGNAPSACEGLDENFQGVFLGINSAPLLFHQHQMICPNCLVQDWRFFEEKGHLFLENGVDLSKTDLYACSYFRRPQLKFRNIKFIRSLGRAGLSLNPNIGIFEGYSVAYGALQIALRWKPEKIEVYGVDFSYSLGGNRFYQTRVGWDLDLHVHEKQIEQIQRAKHAIETQKGISVKFMTDSFVNTMIPSENIC